MSRLPPALAAELDALAALPKCPAGSLSALAMRYDRSENALRIAIYRKRYGRFGRSPSGPRRVPELTPAQLADYRTLTYTGHTRAEALAALGIAP